TWALYLREDARMLELRAEQAAPTEQAALRARAEEKRREASEKLARAKLSADEVVASAPADPDVNRAYALYLVAADASPGEIEVALAKARAPGAASEVESAYVQASLELRQGRGAQAARLLREAVGRDPQPAPLRVEYLLARVEQSVQHEAEARAVLERML